MGNINLLIIDDELGFYGLFRKSLLQHYAFEVASTVERGLALIAQGGWDAVLLDLSFKGTHTYEQGLNIVLPEALKKGKGAFPIIVSTTDDLKSTESIAYQLGAAGFFRKSGYDIPLWDQRIRDIITSFKQRGQSTLNPVVSWEDKFVSADPKMEGIKARLRKLVDYPSSAVLLLGETGTGKEIAAKYLYDARKNAKSPFKAVNLSSFNDDLVESEIFGHVAGAFTGATKDKKGYFEEAKGGVLFLDEIGEISLGLQSKLLRVVQERKFQKVGATPDIDLDAQLVFATNRDLDKEVASGRFREDFYERIKTITISIPPLRERPADILPLIERFLKDLCHQANHPLLGKNANDCFTAMALEALLGYRWPNNVRELRNTIEQLLFEVDFQGLSTIDTPLLPMRFSSAAPTIKPVSDSSAPNINEPPVNWTIRKQTAYNELNHIEKALIQAGGRKDDAAKSLGLKDDQLLRYKVKSKYFVEFPELFSNFPIISKVYKL